MCHERRKHTKHRQEEVRGVTATQDQDAGLGYVDDEVPVP